MSQGYRTWATIKDLTDEQINKAKSLRKSGRRGNRCWRVVARMIGSTEHKVRSACDPTYVDRPNRQSKRYQKKQYDPKKYGLGIRLYIPDEVLEERERRLNAAYRSSSSEMFGDPKVGFSALDKRNHA